MIITFANPTFLLLTAVIPFLILVHFFMLKRKRAHALTFANFDAVAKIRGVDILSKNISVLILTVLVSLLLILSLSGMTIHREMKSSSFSFVIAIDSSRSMEATDILPNRFEAAKEKAKIFVDSTPAGTNIGVVSFSGNSFIEQPLTNDKNLIKDGIRQIHLSFTGGTDLYEALITSNNLLKGEETKSVIILSDGRINVGTMDDFINYANENDIVVHTIALGTKEGGATTYGISKLDEDALKSAAYNTAGEFFSAESNEALQESFNKIIELKTKKISFDMSNYLVLTAFALFLLEYILINTRYNMFP